MNEDFKKAMVKAGLTNKYLLLKTEELLLAIRSGEFVPDNKKEELDKLETWKKNLELRIARGEE